MNVPLVYFVAPLLALALAWPLLKAIADRRLGHHALDMPNARSSHQHPVPRIGGVAVMLGVFAGWLVLGAPSLGLIGGLALGLMLVSLLDDLRGLPVGVRLLAHACAVALLLASLDLPVVAIGVLFPVMLWGINLYNFMDGSDGLAGSMALVGFGAYSLAAGLAGDADLSAAAACVALASLAFLRFNWHPARLFMGDSGAIPLGFLAGALGVLGWVQQAWGAIFPLMVFSPFMADASVTLVKRLLRGERVWQAHREHYYQRLVRAGWGHAGTARFSFMLMLVAGGLALAGDNYPGVQPFLVLAWFVVLGLLMWQFDRRVGKA